MNPGLRMFLMNQEEGNRRMATEDGKYQERGIGMDPKGYPLPYREPRPEFGETPHPENRYRGDDGRYKSGRPRSEMNNREHKWEFTVTPKDEYGGTMDYPRENRVPEWPESNERDPIYGGMDNEDYYDPTGRVIGFGAAMRNHQVKHDQHSGMKRGSHDMQENQPGMMEFDELIMDIHEELKCAEEYAMEAVKHKKRFPELAEVYHRIAADKSTHADMLSKQAKMMAEKVNMSSDWEKENTKIKQKIAEVKRCMEDFRN